MVADAAVTGATGGITEIQLAYFQRIRGMDLKQPRLIGFGITDSAAFQTVSAYASGGIIGSAFIRLLGWLSEATLPEAIDHWVKSIRG